MRSLRLLAAALLGVTTLVAAGATTQSASANSLVLTASRTAVMKYEEFILSGKLLTPKVRTVKLQYKSGDKWLDKLTTTSEADGTFGFQTYTGATRTYRYYAPKSGTSPAIYGLSRKVSLLAQKAEYFAATAHCNGSGNAVVTILVDFYPARPGRSVSFATADGTKWSYEDARGIAAVSYVTGAEGATQMATATAGAFDQVVSFTTAASSYLVPNCFPA